ncbi:MAG: hypothetical protein Ct9H300mP9_7990 [Candidatus Neomarinimicrobiota bacterium]|nr:MAG: hypothetical protein Ct9H300mP9_7990 [Candidatus Neomarinimicrobiota bacterium]
MEIYSIYRISDGPLPTEISVGGTAVGVVASVLEPEPLYTFDPGFETDTYYHSGNIQFLVPVRLKRDLEPGNYILLRIYFIRSAMHDCATHRLPIRYCPDNHRAWYTTFR